MQPAVAASAVDQRRGGAARRAGRLSVGIDFDLSDPGDTALILHELHPLASHHLRKLRDVLLLHEELELGPSRLLAAPVEGDRNAGLLAPLHELFDVAYGALGNCDVAIVHPPLL